MYVHLLGRNYCLSLPAVCSSFPPPSPPISLSSSPLSLLSFSAIIFSWASPHPSATTNHTADTASCHPGKD